MKKYYLAVFALTGMILLSGCHHSSTDGGFDSSPNTNLNENGSDIIEHVPKNVEISNVEFVQIGSTGNLIMELGYENAEKLSNLARENIGILQATSTEELIKISKIIENTKNFSLNWDKDNSLETLLSQYDDSYFKQNNLLIVSVVSPQLEYLYDVSGASIDKDNILKVYVEEIEPEMGSDVVADWIGVIEVSKDYFTSDIKLDAVLE